MFACGSIHLSGWTLLVALVLLLLWVLAGLVAFFNVAMILRTRGDERGLDGVLGEE
jgi:hypothetical protein